MCIDKQEAISNSYFLSTAPPTEYHAMKAHWGVEVQLHPFLNLGTRRR